MTIRLLAFALIACFLSVLAACGGCGATTQKLEQEAPAALSDVAACMSTQLAGQPLTTRGTIKALVTCAVLEAQKLALTPHPDAAPASTDSTAPGAHGSGG